jgi:hypothetical protein
MAMVRSYPSGDSALRENAAPALFTSPLSPFGPDSWTASTSCRTPANDPRSPAYGQVLAFAVAVGDQLVYCSSGLVRTAGVHQTSGRNSASIDGKGDAVDEAGIVTGQKNDRRSQFLGLSYATCRCQ